MASSPYYLESFNHASVEHSSIVPESVDIGSKVFLFDILRTLQRLESHMQTHHDRLNLAEMSVGTESMTASSPARSGGSFNTHRSRHQESPVTTPPQSPTGDYEASIFRTRRKFEFEDDDEPEESILNTSANTVAATSQETREEYYTPHSDDVYSVSDYSRPLSRMLRERASFTDVPRIPSRSHLRPMIIDVDNNGQSLGSNLQSHDWHDTSFAVPYHDVTSRPMFPEPYQPVTNLEATRSRSRKRDQIFMTLEKWFDLCNKYMASIETVTVEVSKQVQTAALGVGSGMKVGTMHLLKARVILEAAKPWKSVKQKVKEMDLKSCMYRTRPYQVA